MKKALLSLFSFALSLSLSAQWYYTSLEAFTNSVVFVNSSRGFASTGWTLARTTDGGTTWAAVASAAMDSIFQGISFPTENVGYAVGLGGNMIKTTDGGNTWTHLNCGTGENLKCVFFVDENTGYVAGYNHAMAKTTDGGMTWQQIASPVDMAFSMYFTSASFGVVTGNVQSIYRTQDGGAHWLEIAFESPNQFVSVHFPDASTGYACGMQDPLTPCMIKSTDGGLKWTEIPVTTGRGLQAVFFLDPNLGYAAGVGGTIIKTTDGGASWAKQTTPDLGTIYSLWFNDVSHGFAGGSALLRTDNGGGAAGLFEKEGNEPVLIRPNPARESVWIAPVRGVTAGTVAVFGMQGKKILEQNAGAFPCRLDVSSLAPGPYFIRINGEKTSYSGSFIRE